MPDERQQKIIDFVKIKSPCSSKEIFDGINETYSYATLKRILAELKDDDYLLTKGLGKGTKYILSPAYDLIRPIDIDKYFEKEIDDRQIIKNFNPAIITKVLKNYSSFTKGELDKLKLLQKEYQKNISQLSKTEYKKELERLAIDLSWKSSQIEGNTYTLLETERLLKEKQTASGKTKEEAVMLLNHKDTLDFIIENTDYLNPNKIV